MGHGDDLVLCDANFPAEAIARRTTTGRLVRLDGVGIRRAAKAILSVLPLDAFVEQPVLRMEVVGRPGEKIGRASCRERVCQYVSISVVAVSLKKKKCQVGEDVREQITHNTERNLSTY